MIYVTKYNFGRPVVAGGHDGAVVLHVEGGAPKVNQSHVRPLDPSEVPFLLGIVVDVVVRVDKQDVLGLEVRVRQLVLVQEQHGVDQLVRDVAHVLYRIALVVVVLLVVKRTTLGNDKARRSKRGQLSESF